MAELNVKMSKINILHKRVSSIKVLAKALFETWKPNFLRRRVHLELLGTNTQSI